jgi:MFS family permease
MLGSALFTGSIVVGNTFWQTMEQQHVPNEALGRVDSISWMVALVFMPIAYIVAGPVADLLGVRETLALAAAVGFISTCGVLVSRSVREARRIDEAPSGPVESPPETALVTPSSLPSPSASAAGGSRGRGRRARLP